MRRTRTLALAICAASAITAGQSVPALAAADVPMRTPRPPRLPGSAPRTAPSRPASQAPRTASAPRPAATTQPRQQQPLPTAAPRPSFAPAPNPFTFPQQRQNEPQSNASIAVCCAWGAGILDGVTFSVEAPNTDVYDIITKGVMAWQSAVGVKLRRVDVSQAEVQIRFETMGSNTQGSTTRRPDSLGFIRGATITVAGSYYMRGNSPDLIEQIAKHEFGHALGANHANGDGYLMSTTLTDGSPNITDCDKRAVLAANEWYLVKHLSEPYEPVARVQC